MRQNILSTANFINSEAQDFRLVEKNQTDVQIKLQIYIIFVKLNDLYNIFVLMFLKINVFR